MWDLQKSYLLLCTLVGIIGKIGQCVSPWLTAASSSSAFLIEDCSLADTPYQRADASPLCCTQRTHWGSGLLWGLVWFCPSTPAYADTRFAVHLTVLPSSSHCLRSGQAASCKGRDSLPSKHLIFTVHYLMYISALLLIHSEWGSISNLKESLIY